MLFVYASFIYASFILYGVILERAQTSNGSWLYIACFCNATSVLIALCVLYFTRTPFNARRRHASIALFQTLASLSSFYSLNYVNYPTHTLIKSAKPVAVLVTSFLFSRKPISKNQLKTTLFASVGILVFFGANIDEIDSSIPGLVLIFASLVCDAIVGGLQHELNGSPYENMLFINMWSFLLTCMMLVCNGAVLEVRPSATLLGLGLTMGIGQVFIFAMIGRYGPLVCSLTTTTRKIFSIITSIFLHGHSMVLQQWIGICLVFCGLLSNINSHSLR